jgi:ribulose 1,5-bisphosphate synthetase/thiazole synthase
MSFHDVIIVGAGQAGLSVAYFCVAPICRCCCWMPRKPEAGPGSMDGTR